MSVASARQSSWQDEEKFLSLPGGLVAIPTYHVTRHPALPPPSDAAKHTAKDHTWEPKMARGQDWKMEPQAQRTPDITVDNITFLYKRDGSMPEPMLVLGEFNKTCNVGGVTVPVRGLALSAGGHYERMGNRPDYLRDKGNYNLFHAAETELIEEIGVGKEGIAASAYIACIDDVDGDMRKHVERHILMRHIDATPTESEELQSLVLVPLSKLKELMEGRITYNVDDEQLGFVLDHDSLLKTVMELPNAKTFIEKMTE